MTFKSFIAREYYRWTMSSTIMGLINFILLVTALSPDLSRLTGLTELQVKIFAIPGAFFITWLIGFILDKMKYRQSIIQTDQQRNPPMIRLISQSNENNKMLKDITRRLNEKNN